MSKAKKYMVLDTETITNEKGEVLVFDFAYTIHTLNGETPVESYNAIVKESACINNPSDAIIRTEFKGTFAGNKYVQARKNAVYKGLYENCLIDARTAKQISEHTRDAIERHGITEVYAYNCKYDKGVIAKSWEIFKCESPIPESVEYRDIMKGVSCLIGLSEKYHKFCIMNGYVTSTFNTQMKAETVIRFLTENTDYEEWHTALHDCLDEWIILRKVIRSRKPVNWDKGISVLSKDYIELSSDVAEKQGKISAREYKRLKKLTDENLKALESGEPINPIEYGKRAIEIDRLKLKIDKH